MKSNYHNNKYSTDDSEYPEQTIFFHETKNKLIEQRIVIRTEETCIFLLNLKTFWMLL